MRHRYMTYEQMRRRMPANMKAIWVYLFSFDPCRPTLKQIAKDNDLSLPAVRRNLLKLQNEGLIRITKGPKGKEKHHGYYFTVYAEPFKEPPTGNVQTPVLEDLRVTSNNLTGNVRDLQRVTFDTPKGSNERNNFKESANAFESSDPKPGWEDAVEAPCSWRPNS